MSNPYSMATPVQPLDPTQVFDIQSGADRNAFLQKLGAKNCRPPLPRSSHLLVKATGQVLPYNPMFAEQQDLVLNCDENGNTDPKAWMATVQPEISAEDFRNEMEIIRLKAMEIGMKMTDGFKQITSNPVRVENIPPSVMSFAQYGEQQAAPPAPQAPQAAKGPHENGAVALQDFDFGATPAEASSQVLDDGTQIVDVPRPSATVPRKSGRVTRNA